MKVFTRPLVLTTAGWRSAERRTRRRLARVLSADWWRTGPRQDLAPRSPARPALTPAQLEQLATTADAAGLHERATEYRAISDRQLKQGGPILQVAGSSRRTA